MIEAALRAWDALPLEVRVLVLIESWRLVDEALGGIQAATERTENKLDDRLVGAARRVWGVPGRILKKLGGVKDDDDKKDA